MATAVVDGVRDKLLTWYQSVCEDLGDVAIYCFGSLIYRDGEQFGDASDVDLLVVMPEMPDSIERAGWIERLLDHKAKLEDKLGKLLRRDRGALICSVVAVSSLEITADLHKDGAPSFFSKNVFWNLATNEHELGIADAGSRPIAERLVGECVKFAQKMRNQYLAVNARGDERLSSFDDADDPAPKPYMRHAAMVRFLEDDGDGDPGAEYDVDIGANRITVLLDERREQLGDLVRRYGSRRGGRAERAPLSSKDQLLLAELIFDAAIKVEAKAEAIRARSQKPSLKGAHSTMIFAERFANAFPGVRGAEWFDDQDDIRMRLERLLAEPLEFADGTPIWWSRGGANLHVSSFALADEFALLNGGEMKIRKVAAVNTGSYKYDFVYVEVDPLEPTGLYPHTTKRIAETEAGDSPFPYYWEEYAIVDGKHLITRSVYDDGSAVIDGDLQSVGGRAELRLRYVTPYNFVLAAGGASIMSMDYDRQLEEHLNAMLKGEDRLMDIAKDVSRLPTGRF